MLHPFVRFVRNLFVLIRARSHFSRNPDNGCSFGWHCCRGWHRRRRDWRARHAGVFVLPQASEEERAGAQRSLRGRSDHRLVSPVTLHALRCSSGAEIVQVLCRFLAETDGNASLKVLLSVRWQQICLLKGNVRLLVDC